MNIEIEESYSAEEVAKLLHIHYQTALKMINSGTLRGYRLGNRWRVPASELKRFTSISTNGGE